MRRCQRSSAGKGSLFGNHPDAAAQRYNVHRWRVDVLAIHQEDVQRLSGGKITNGYEASIVIGRASNPSVDKVKALADGLGVDVNELFHVACGRLEEPKDRASRSPATEALMRPNPISENPIPSH